MEGHKWTTGYLNAESRIGKSRSKRRETPNAQLDAIPEPARTPNWLKKLRGCAGLPT